MKVADPAAQVEFVERECGADSDLRLCVEEMLRHQQDRISPSGDGLGTETGEITLDHRAKNGLDEAAMQPQFPDGARLGKYEIKNFISRGGMGEVYRGFDPLIEREVALKLLPASLAAQPDSLRRFLSEARAVGKLLHPHTVVLYELGQDGATQYLAMEFVPGGSIANLLAREGKLDWRRATRMMHEVCLGLAAAHAVGVIHRDIKPENLLRTLDDHVKITDFGLAKAMDSLSKPGPTQAGHLLGTPNYMSPEQFNGGSLDHRSDLYSAGATYCALLTGKRPFPDATTIYQLMYAHCNAPAPDLRVLAPEIPAGCATVVARAMAKAPADRYGSAEEMAAALAALLAEKAERPSPAIWLVEPSALQARIIKSLLAEVGAPPSRIFSSVADTLAAAAQGLPAAILSALHLDDGSGEDLADRVRALPGGSGVFCFLLSSDPVLSSATSFRPGRPIVLMKPVTKDVLALVAERVRALHG